MERAAEESCPCSTTGHNTSPVWARTSASKQNKPAKQTQFRAWTVSFKSCPSHIDSIIVHLSAWQTMYGTKPTNCILTKMNYHWELVNCRYWFHFGCNVCDILCWELGTDSLNCSAYQTYLVMLAQSRLTKHILVPSNLTFMSTAYFQTTMIRLEMPTNAMAYLPMFLPSWYEHSRHVAVPVTKTPALSSSRHIKFL